ncbi:TPA: CaiF/GrlA family transcriptional regulator [Citrobacter werkmanii]|nr:CaiF/GrlA family transcriptional regulator [Citrobacter werkmanii]
MKEKILPGIVRGKNPIHGDFYMPANLRYLGNIPLYRAVAVWGTLHGREFNRYDISEVFQVDPRRASGILNYLANRRRQDDIIIFEARKVCVGGGCHVLYLRILDVKEDPVRMRQKSPRALAKTRESGNQDRRLARWFLSRPSGNNPEQLARWKATCPVEGEAC